MTLVNSEQLADYLNGATWSPRQQLHIEEIVLPGVQRELETYLNRPVEPMHVREARQPDCEGRVWPTVSPVWQVLAIHFAPGGDSIALDTSFEPVVPMAPSIVTAREWDPAGTKMKAPNWIIQQGSAYIFVPGYIWDPSVPLSGSYVVVEYIGGYNGYVDEGLKLDVLRVAAREVERTYDNAVSLRDGAGVALGPSDPRPKGWQPDELAKWDRLRRRVVVS
jgi:hypothetical protein